MIVTNIQLNCDKSLYYIFCFLLTSISVGQILTKTVKHKTSIGKTGGIIVHIIKNIYL